MDSSVWFILIFTALVLGTTACVVYHLLTRDRRQRKKSEGWVETTATVTEASLVVQSGGRGPGLYELTLAYRYSATGGAQTQRQKFFVDSFESHATSALPGRTLPLRYDPNDAISNAVFTADVRNLCRATQPRKR